MPATRTLECQGEPSPAEPAGLLAFLQVDQSVRWERGDEVPVEAYLEQYFQLQASREAVLHLIRNELDLRRKKGETPQQDEYLERFGPLDGQLQSLFDNCRPEVSTAGPGDRAAGFVLAALPAVPGYEVLAELGRGGMGVVYQARQTSLKRLVALKMILAGPHSGPNDRVRFRTEAEAVARLQHPNIVQIHEVDELDGRPFLTLEYIDGGSLQQKAAGRAQPEREAARLVEALARAVYYTHQRGILHRDLKPTNILMTADGTPKITDFGLAKFVDADDGPTRTEALIGTPHYMSPEQASGNTRNIGAPADIYSLGAILYELLTGRVPFQGKTLVNTLEQVRTQEPLPPRRLRSSIALDVQTIALKCLEKEPGNRYASAEALADDLRRFQEGQPILARPVAPWRRLGRLVRRRPGRLAVALGAAALGCLALTFGWYFSVAGRLAGHQAEANYQQFVQYRNEALIYGLVTPEEGALFLGTAPADNLKAAEAAARKALALAGVPGEAETAPGDPCLPASRQAEVTADCYALLLVLASVRAQLPPMAQGSPERWKEALRLLDRANQLGLQTRAYHLRRAHCLEQLGQPAQARQERDRAAALPIENAVDHFLIGEEHYRRGDWEGAMTSFNGALARQPGHFWAQFFLAVCQLKAQHWEAARAGLNGCLAQQPDFVWAYLFRSFAHEKLQALPEAAADFQKALRLNPNADARYVLFLTRGIVYFNQQAFAEAAADFSSARDLKPDQYNAYLNLAQAYLAQGHFEQAEQQVSKAMQLKPPAQVVFGYRVERGRRLLRDRKYADAVKACEAALELFPDQPFPYEVLGRALLALGRYQQAATAFDLYLVHGGQAGADVFRGRGQARMQLGKYPEAAEDYTRALQRAPDAELFEHRGWAHFFADAWKLALRDFTKALELDPVAGDAFTGRGLARVMLGHYREAVADAEAALQLKPRTPEMMHNLACIFALAVSRAEADSAEPNRQAVANDFRGRAIAAIQQTLQILPADQRASFWREKIHPDPALASLHHDARFERLQRDFGQR